MCFVRVCTCEWAVTVRSVQTMPLVVVRRCDHSPNYVVGPPSGHVYSTHAHGANNIINLRPPQSHCCGVVVADFGTSSSSCGVCRGRNRIGNAIRSARARLDCSAVVLARLEPMRIGVVHDSRSGRSVRCIRQHRQRPPGSISIIGGAKTRLELHIVAALIPNQC